MGQQNEPKDLPDNIVLVILHTFLGWVAHKQIRVHKIIHYFGCATFFLYNNRSTSRSWTLKEYYNESTKYFPMTHPLKSKPFIIWKLVI